MSPPNSGKTRAAARRKPAAPKARSAAEIREIFTRFRTARPEPKGELDYVNAFTLLVAVLLSAQATDVGVNKATKRLFELADTPEKMLALGGCRQERLGGGGIGLAGGHGRTITPR